MNRLLSAFFIVLLAVITVPVLCMAQSPGNSGAEKQIQYEALSPWADVDPIPMRGISPRLDSLAGKKIGIFVNSKRAAMPMAKSVDKRLKEMHPDIQTIIFHSTEPNVNEIETKNKDKFTVWLNDIDAAILLVGD
ncbi:MAG: hypothetical protein JW927_22735 [Deltaproteobacteria bacterium]|nr:hypothetical protein [Deltaproteobacteria bacterium]